MSSFEIGNVFGMFIMSFAIFVIVQFVLSKIPALRQRHAVTTGVAFSLSFLLLLPSGNSIVAIAVTVVLLAVACFWRFNDLVRRSKRN